MYGLGCQSEVSRFELHSDTVSDVQKAHRDSQTYQTCSVSQSTMREQGTQMAKVGLYVTDAADRIVHPRRSYNSSSQWDADRLVQVCLIQRVVRGVFARMRVKRLRKEKAERALQLQIAHESILQSQLSKDAFEVERRANPKTVYDVHLLHSELASWVSGEIARIKAAFDHVECRSTHPEYIAEMQELLAKSIKMRGAIKIFKTRKIEYKPKFFLVRDQLVEVVNEGILARTALYNQLVVEPPVSHNDRKQLLLEALLMVEESRPDLVALLNREMDLLNRNRPLPSMTGLRLRIANMFFKFLHDV